MAGFFVGAIWKIRFNDLFLLSGVYWARRRIFMDARDQHKDSDQATDYMPPEVAAAYVRKARIVAACIFLGILFGGVQLFDIGVSSWEPLPRETVSAPRDNKKTQQNTPRENYAPSFSSAGEAAFDPLLPAHPRNAYDLPVYVADAPQENLRITAGEVRAIAPRKDTMSDGSARKNLYARTEFYQPESGGTCFFHQYMGTVATYRVGERVRIQYDTSAKDICGSSRIIKP
jgi:hypothetical protein